MSPDKVEKALKVAAAAGYEKGHTEQVRTLALRLFDELSELHRLGEKERVMLDLACILHDVAWQDSGKSHHKAARDMILSSRELSFEDDTERTQVAMIVRYHKGALPDEDHRFYGDLDPGSRSNVDKLASIIRVADGLDRTHFGVVKDLKCRILPEKVVIHLAAKERSGIDDDAAVEKSDLFRKTFGKSIEIEWD